MGGMISATFLAVFFVPAFYVVFQWLSELRNGPAPLVAVAAGGDQLRGVRPPLRGRGQDAGLDAEGSC